MTQATQLAVRFIQTGGAILARVVDATRREHRRLTGVTLEPAVTAALAVEAGAAVQAAARRQRRRTLGVKVDVVVDEITLATVVARVAVEADLRVRLVVARVVTGAVVARETLRKRHFRCRHRFSGRINLCSCGFRSSGFRSGGFRGSGFRSRGFRGLGFGCSWLRSDVIGLIGGRASSGWWCRGCDIRQLTIEPKERFKKYTIKLH